jgi:hypothetical protein
MQTYRQFVAAEYWTLRREYPDASPHDCSEIAGSLQRRSEWVAAVTAEMRTGTPTRRQWPRLLAELGAEYIARRVWHDAPGSADRYLAAGLMLPV